jgi:hypothetical protein
MQCPTRALQCTSYAAALHCCCYLLGSMSPDTALHCQRRVVLRAGCTSCPQGFQLNKVRRRLRIQALQTLVRYGRSAEDNIATPLATCHLVDTGERSGSLISLDVSKGRRGAAGGRAAASYAIFAQRRGLRHISVPRELPGGGGTPWAARPPCSDRTASRQHDRQSHSSSASRWGAGLLLCGGMLDILRGSTAQQLQQRCLWTSRLNADIEPAPTRPSAL